MQVHNLRVVLFMPPPPQSKGVGHIGFGENGVGISVQVGLFLLNQWMDFDQTFINTLLGGPKELVNFW